MSERLRVIIACIVVAGFLVAGLGGAYGLSIYAANQSQRKWCDTLSLLTKKPVAPPADPEANPSREGQYLFYVDLVRLRGQFGC